MFVNTQQVQIGVQNYIREEIAKQATGMARYGYDFIASRSPKIIEHYINKFRNNILMEEFFDENGNLDIDKLYNEAVEISRRTGKVAVCGIWVSEDTLKTIYTYIIR